MRKKTHLHAMHDVGRIAPAGFTAWTLLQGAFAAMVAILFLQSSLDKIFNWKSEKQFLTGHFAKSPLNGLVPFMMPVITLVELSAGTCSAIGLIQLFMNGWTLIGAWGMVFGTLAIIFLFLGQRLAKDYAGAAALVPYFLLCAAGMYVFTPGALVFR